jgi:prophage tail gpP-like protein
MTRHIIAASLAVLMFAAPAIAFAADPAPAATEAPAKKTKTHKAATHKAKKSKKAAAPAS